MKKKKLASFLFRIIQFYGRKDFKTEWTDKQNIYKNNCTTLLKTNRLLLIKVMKKKTIDRLYKYKALTQEYN